MPIIGAIVFSIEGTEVMPQHQNNGPGTQAIKFWNLARFAANA